MREAWPVHRMPGVVYRDEQTLARYSAAGALKNETLAGAFRAVAARFPNRTALVEADWSCTYRELDKLTDKAGAAFLQLGLQPLDRILFQMANSKELVIAVIACLKAGLIPICTLAAHRKLEIGYLGQHAEARAHFVQGDDPKFDFVEFSRELRTSIPSLQHTVVLRGTANADGSVHLLDDLMASQTDVSAQSRLAQVQLDPFQVALFQLSGGTSGVPKIIPRFHNEYLYALQTEIAFHGLDENIVAHTPNPMMHNAPMIAVWGPALLSGGAVAICASLDPAVMGPFLARRQPNWLFLPAPAVSRLKESGWLDRLDFSGARGFYAGSNAAKLRALLENVPIWPTFGMTEGLMCSCNDFDPEEARRTTVGRPLSPFDEVKILNPDSESVLPDGEVGEMVVRGPSTLRGYYSADDRNKVAFTSDGFYRSGDLMRIQVIDARRYLVFEGRVKDVVDRGGEKINCEEVERICAGHQSVGAVAVVAMPDPVYGQRACAFIIPIPGSTAPDVKQLGMFLQTQGMAKFKWPERIEVVTEFPLTSSGKLSKPRLREMIEDRLRTEIASTQLSSNGDKAGSAKAKVIGR